MPHEASRGQRFELDNIICADKHRIDRGEDQGSMSPKLLVRRGQMMEGDHLENEWNNDAQRCSIDQNLISRKPKHACDLQDLNNIVRHGRGERGHAGPVPDVTNALDQGFSTPELCTGCRPP